jgi:FKBP-type peptidyl-prolyl cis-trans isomerase (trigger factor)
MKVRVEVNAEVTNYVYAETVHFFRKKQFDGFDYNKVPGEYLEATFGAEITKKLKSYLFRHHVIDALIAEITAQKIPYANYPRLTHIEVTPTQGATFCFDISLADHIELKEWKHFAFKGARRKRYKDLDKQVVQFVEQEVMSHKKVNAQTVEESDWVCIEIKLLDHNQVSLPCPLLSVFWIKIKKCEAPDQFKEHLLGKKVGESFVTFQLDFDDDSNEIDTCYYNFFVTVVTIIKGAHLSLDIFKQTFKLKNKLEIHNKLMEVFSFRNDLSQRKSIIEEMFNLFLTKHRFEVPKHLVLRRQEDILLVIMKQPDYHVYKAQRDFVDQIEVLAEKQLKEEILIDQISYNENVKVELVDMQQYLNLFNNRRLKEFIYFKPAFEKIEEIEDPLNASVLAQAVMREKTLNTILYTLTH